MLFGTEQIKKIRGRFLGGERVDRLAEDFGCSLFTAYQIVNNRAYCDANYVPPSRKTFNLERAINLREQGYSNYEIAKAVGFSHEYVRRKLNRIMGAAQIKPPNRE